MVLFFEKRVFVFARRAITVRTKTPVKTPYRLKPALERYFRDGLVGVGEQGRRFDDAKVVYKLPYIHICLFFENVTQIDRVRKSRYRRSGGGA